MGLLTHLPSYRHPLVTRLRRQGSITSLPSLRVDADRSYRLGWFEFVASLALFASLLTPEPNRVTLLKLWLMPFVLVSSIVNLTASNLSEEGSRVRLIVMSASWRSPAGTRRTG
jgi:hypothetical protein